MRRLIVCGAVKGSPGVTTWALALAASWPLQLDGGVRPVVVEADADGGDIALRFALPYTPGLLDVAATVGQQRPGSVLGAVQELPFGTRVVVSPAAAESCTEAVRLLAEDGGRVLRGAEEDHGTVIVDVGRLGVAGMELLAAADEAVLVCRGGVNDLVHVAARCEAVGEAAEALRLAMVGSCGYPVEEITNAVQVGRVHAVPWDARTAAALGGRRGAGYLGKLGGRGRWRRPPLLAAAAGWAERLAAGDNGVGGAPSPTTSTSEQPTLTSRLDGPPGLQPTLEAGMSAGGGERW